MAEINGLLGGYSGLLEMWIKDMGGSVTGNGLAWVASKGDQFDARDGNNGMFRCAFLVLFCNANPSTQSQLAANNRVQWIVILL